MPQKIPTPTADSQFGRNYQPTPLLAPEPSQTIPESPHTWLSPTESHGELECAAYKHPPQTLDDFRRITRWNQPFQGRSRSVREVLPEALLWGAPEI